MFLDGIFQKCHKPNTAPCFGIEMQSPRYYQNRKTAKKMTKTVAGTHRVHTGDFHFPMSSSKRTLIHNKITKYTSIQNLNISSHKKITRYPATWPFPSLERMAVPQPMNFLIPQNKDFDILIPDLGNQHRFLPNYIFILKAGTCH